MLEGRQVNVTSRLGGHQDTSGGCAQLLIRLVCWERQSPFPGWQSHQSVQEQREGPQRCSPGKSGAQLKA